MSDVKIGWDSEFWLGNSETPSVLTQIAEVISIVPPNPQTDAIEATHFKSPNRAREYISGLIEYGEITVGINYIAGSPSDVILTGAQASGASRAAKIVIPTSTASAPNGWAFTFDAIVTGYEKDIPIDDRQTATITLRVAGAVTEAAVVTP